MKNHPYADLFPMMTDTEFKALCKDIKANGLRDPIITHNDQILDGRNRYAACLKVNEKPRYEKYWGTNAKLFVISKNLHRRHLSEQQRALIAAELVSGAESTTSPAKIGQIVSIDTKVTIPEASQAMNISVPSVNRALKIEKQGSETLKQAVKDETISLTKAAKLADQPKQTQSKLVLQKLAGKPVDISPEEQSVSSLRVMLRYLDNLLYPQLAELGIKVADKLNEATDTAESDPKGSA